MSFSRLVQFSLFGHVAASIASYELGRHKPKGYSYGYSGKTSSREVKDETKRIVLGEFITAGGIYLMNPETAILLVAYSLPFYAYQLGRYRANVAEEKASVPTPKR